MAAGVDFGGLFAGTVIMQRSEAADEAGAARLWSPASWQRTVLLIIAFVVFMLVRSVTSFKAEADVPAEALRRPDAGRTLTNILAALK
jgi:hypothetical protein